MTSSTKKNGESFFVNNLDLRILSPTKPKTSWERLLRFLLPARPRLMVVGDPDKPFHFVDSFGDVWYAEYRHVVNGLSTPWFFWRLFPPFSGFGIKTSVIHDVACDKKNRPSWKAHRMVYYSARCEGMSKQRAFLMWFAVRYFGPKFYPLFC